MTTSSMPNLFTADIDAAVEFYCDQLGFSLDLRVPPVGRPEHVVLRVGDSMLALSTPRAIAAVGLEPTMGNSFELVVWVEDVDGEVERLRAAGVPILVEPYDHPGGHRRASIADPDQHWLAVVDAR